MELRRALDQLETIHSQLARTEVFRGYRSVTMGLTSVAAMVLAALQSGPLRPETSREFVSTWFVVGLACAATCYSDLALRLIRERNVRLRRRTMIVVGQSIPALAAGALATPVLLRLGLGSIVPGLWAVFFSMSVFAARPYLPRSVGWVAAAYFLAGLIMLGRGWPGTIPSPWGLGATFGIGQAALAVILYVNLEREETP